MGNGKNHDHDDELFQSHIGGAAMLEGVMMRGRYSWAVAVREPDGGIYVEEHDVPGYGKKQAWRSLAARARVCLAGRVARPAVQGHGHHGCARL